MMRMANLKLRSLLLELPWLLLALGLFPYIHTLRVALPYVHSSHSCGGADCEDCGRFFDLFFDDPFERGVILGWLGLFVAAFVVAAFARLWPAKGIIFVIGASLCMYAFVVLI